jgi:hypothetical protein
VRKYIEVVSNNLVLMVYILTRSSWEWFDWVSERSSGSGLNTGSLTLLQQLSSVLTHRKIIEGFKLIQYYAGPPILAFGNYLDR